MATKFKMQKLANGNIRTCEVKLSFPQLFHAVQGTDDDGKPSGKPKRSTACLFPPGADLSVLEAEIKRVAAEAFPKKPLKGLRIGLRDQGEKDYAGYEDGAFFLTCATEKKVPIVNRKREPVTEEDEVYPGADAILTIRVFPFSKKGDGIGFGLQAVQLLGTGEHIASKPADPDEEFEELEELEEGESADSIFGDEE
jgi:hypothetical protein